MKFKRRTAASPFSVGRVQQPVNGIDWSRTQERISLAINQIIKPRAVRRSACCSVNISATMEA